MVKAEQEAAERQYEKEEAERKRKREEIKRRKRMLDAAFDGEVDDMEAILKEVIYYSILGLPFPTDRPLDLTDFFYSILQDKTVVRP